MVEEQESQKIDEVEKAVLLEVISFVRPTYRKLTSCVEIAPVS